MLPAAREKEDTSGWISLGKTDAMDADARCIDGDLRSSWRHALE